LEQKGNKGQKRQNGLKRQKMQEQKGKNTGTKNEKKVTNHSNCENKSSSCTVG
jgi:hypothetical protein